MSRLFSRNARIEQLNLESLDSFLTPELEEICNCTFSYLGSYLLNMFQEKILQYCSLIAIQMFSKLMLIHMCYWTRVRSGEMLVEFFSRFLSFTSWLSISWRVLISNGKRTSCRPIRSVIIRVITKSDRSPICLSRLWLQTDLNDTKSCYQLIIKIAISEKSRIAKLWKKGKICIKIPSKEM